MLTNMHVYSAYKDQPLSIPMAAIQVINHKCNRFKSAKGQLHTKMHNIKTKKEKEICSQPDYPAWIFLCWRERHRWLMTLNKCIQSQLLMYKMTPIVPISNSFSSHHLSKSTFVVFCFG